MSHRHDNAGSRTGLAVVPGGAVVRAQEHNALHEPLSRARLNPHISSLTQAHTQSCLSFSTLTLTDSQVSMMLLSMQRTATRLIVPS